MIEFHDVSVRYAGAPAPALRDADFTIPEGELVLVVGPTGSGKSTLLRCINGLVPHFSGGTLGGRVVVEGRDTRTHRPRDLADLVGVVVQDPVASFVTDTVEEEIAYGMEALGVDATAMRRRVEETLDLLGLAEVRGRALRDLSGGQQQRVAIGAVLAAGPRILVLDEPTSALDPVAAEDVLSALQRLVHDVGLTVVLAEHRLERVIHHADRVLLVCDGQVSPLLDPAEAMVGSPVFPPVIGLGRVSGWVPLPLSVRDARRRAASLRRTLEADGAARHADPAPQPTTESTATSVEAHGLVVRRGPLVALRGIDLALHPGTVTAVMGRNGAGKSTLLGALSGQLPASAGRASVAGLDPAGAAPATLVRHVGLVPQDPTVLLYAESVAQECRAADRDFGAPAGTARELLRTIAGDVDDELHPRDLSEGQRLSLALAVVLTGRPPVLLLDEPTRGLDYQAKARLVTVLRDLAGSGHTVLLATHDVELAAEVATDVVVLADGEVVAQGPARGVLAGSPAFAPQVAKIVHPLPYLTVADVSAALERAS
ncbi:ABC transporter ATP-binding protein [Oryzihumus leptocrescens]|uniref:Energy-coupling factor transport system ATP-binding protein n=1 Tax=Oryzihumus leptocrescens TaxID=297536 RepID=A0A542ZII8_9MICO|nr:ABC transporter ATP-binding protein [Oryzihumus leptocrescens]TQL60161.1 energy-coupling factor transport system ATP-binding protein [Oryzihumus leptocrescens]